MNEPWQPGRSDRIHCCCRSLKLSSRGVAARCHAVRAKPFDAAAGGASRVLHRTTRSVSVSDAGLRLLERLRPAFGEIAGALEDLNQERQRPLGRLRIYATHWAAAVVIAPIWGRFLSTYPEVHLELAVGEAPIDIVAKGFDAGIGPHARAPADMIAVRVMGPMRVVVVGAPTYFARRRPPRTPDDLARHSCVQFRRAADGDVFA